MNAEAMRHYSLKGTLRIRTTPPCSSCWTPRATNTRRWRTWCTISARVWRRCAPGRVGRPELGIRLIEEALDKGFFYGERTMRDSPSWEPLQGTPEFERLVEICKARQGFRFAP